MTLLDFFIFCFATIAWLFIGMLVYGHLVDNKGIHLSRFWEINLFWPLGIIAWVYDD